MRQEIMDTETLSYKAAFDLADAVIRYCLPQWFPSLATIVCTVTMGVAFLSRWLARERSDHHGSGKTCALSDGLVTDSFGQRIEV